MVTTIKNFCQTALAKIPKVLVDTVTKESPLSDFQHSLSLSQGINFKQRWNMCLTILFRFFNSLGDISSRSHFSGSLLRIRKVSLSFVISIFKSFNCASTNHTVRTMSLIEIV